MPDFTEITKSNFDTDVLNAKGFTLVYYYAPWCKPCQEMDEVLQVAAGEMQDKMALVQVNTDTESEIITQQKVRVIPSYQVFKDGKLEDTMRGPMSKLELIGLLSKHLFQEETDT